jgi:hypothetical protein
MRGQGRKPYGDLFEMVAISHSHRFIYIKTIKTGGTSIEMFFEPLCTSPKHIVEHITPTIESSYGVIGRRSPAPRFHRLRRPFEKWYNHMPASKIRRRLGAEKFDSYLKISSIRNPYQYAISLYHMAKFLRGEIVPSIPQERKLNFQEFIAGRWTNQLHLLTVGGEVCVQKFIRLEHVSADLQSIVNEIGADITQLTLPHMKHDTKRSRNLADFYDKASADRVRNHMKWVFDRFEYSTEIPDL